MRPLTLALVALVLAGCGTPEATITHPSPTRLDIIAYTHDRDADAGKEVSVLVRALAEGDRETRCRCDVNVRHDADGDGSWTQAAVEPLYEGTFRSYVLEGEGRTVFAAEVVVHTAPRCGEGVRAIPLQATLTVPGGPVLSAAATTACP